MGSSACSPSLALPVIGLAAALPVPLHSGYLGCFLLCRRASSLAPAFYPILSHPVVFVPLFLLSFSLTHSSNLFLSHISSIHSHCPHPFARHLPAHGTLPVALVGFQPSIPTTFSPSDQPTRPKKHVPPSTSTACPPPVCRALQTFYLPCAKLHPPSTSNTCLLSTTCSILQSDHQRRLFS